MPPPYACTQYLTEFQTLSLSPDMKVGSWSSDVRKALQAGLRTTASHPKCYGIYWLRQRENPHKIVIISKWTEPVDFTTSSSYLPPLLSHLESPPTRSIHVNHTLHSFSSYSISKFLTVYFPIRLCSWKFKSQITSNVNSFVAATESTYDCPESLRYVAAGWIKETKMVGGEVASGFMFCLMWTDRKSEQAYKSQNEHWRVLMRYLKGMGMLAEEQYHGKAFQVLGNSQRGRVEFSDDSSDEEDVELLDLMEEQLRNIAPTQAPEPRMADAKAESDFTKLWNQVEHFCYPLHKDRFVEDDSSTDHWFDHSVEQTVAEDLDDESADSTPILTPSSSTMSLNSLFDDLMSVQQIPGTWKSVFDISHAQVSGRASPTSDLKEDVSHEPVLPEGKFVYEHTGQEEAEENAICVAAIEEISAKVHALTKNLSSNAHSSQPSATPESVSNNRPQAHVSSSSSSKSHSNLLLRSAVAKWDPETELRAAKTRFWQRRRKSPSSSPSSSPSPSPSPSHPHSPHSESKSIDVSTRSSAERGRPAERYLTIDPLRGVEDKRRGSWWDYVKECLPSPSKAGSRVVDVNVEAGGEADIGGDLGRASS